MSSILLADDAPSAIFLLAYSRFATGVDFSNANGVVNPVPADGIRLPDAMRKIEKAASDYPGGRKAAIIVAGSSANRQSYTQAEPMHALTNQSMVAYVFEVPGLAPAGQPGIFAEIASDSRGQRITLSFTDLPDAMNRTLIAVRNRYFVGYAPSKTAKDGKYRNVDVTLTPPRGLPPVHASSPPDYYAPAQ